jgi:hypothetical protein
MIKINNRDQLEAKGLESWRGILTDKKLNILKKSWAEVFRGIILPSIPIDRVSNRYSRKMGRPTKELRAIVGAVILQEILDLTDGETITNMALNQQWHYALDCFEEADQVISLKTLWSMRKNVTDTKIYNEIFSITTDKLISKLGINVSKQRLDSVHVHSNMARLGRIRIQVRTLKAFLKNLKKKCPLVFKDKITSEIIDKYFKKDAESIFSHIKPSERKRTLQNIGEDIYSLFCLLDNNEKISRMQTYKTLLRAFYEHFDVEENVVIVKKPKDVSSDSIQNPSDPDAGYDGHKGQGYHTQMMETYRDDEDRASEEVEGIDIITHVHTEPANEHDSNAVIPAIDDVKSRGHNCERLLADAAYGGTDKIEKAQEKGVELVSPTLGRHSEKQHGSFEYDTDTYEVTACPAGKKPDEIRYNKKDSITAVWYEATCAECEFINSCPAKSSKQGRKHYYTISSAKCHLRRQYEDSQAFKDIYRYRSGIEATNSRFISMTGARRSRYRGLKKMSFSQTLKALAINMHRVAGYMQRIGDCGTIFSFLARYLHKFCFFKPKYGFSSY